ncbi:MAG: phenylalanine--tRNA ligase subunit alpha [Clostridiales bacterium]|nr:phenylalanine--tRNA ligase subunit alpha [Clostridiales bacterium]
MSDLKESLNKTREEFEKKIKEIQNSADIEKLRVEFFGKKGKLTGVLRNMGSLKPEERPEAGKMVNEVRAKMEEVFAQNQAKMKAMENARKLKREVIDVTLPTHYEGCGARHPLNMAINEICDIFLGLGYSIGEGPEVEYDKYNFELLRIPKGHPARDTQDTFYINDNILLRTQTSGMQIRIMEELTKNGGKPPIKVVCPGKVYRQDTLDATHSPVFHQIEGLVVDKGVTMGDLVGSLRLFAKKLFGEKTDIRLRPHHFPFTEPSVEVDLTCWKCGGSGCNVCKGEGWIEVLGAGMVHPEVLENCGIDSSVYSGFAFGIGVERTAMGRYGIDDIRLLYENDVRFLKQFK